MAKVSTWFYKKLVCSRIASGAISELKGAKLFLKYTGETMTPDKVKEILRLSQSGATLGRKFRDAASCWENPELTKNYYTTQKGKKVVEFCYNVYYKESK